MSSPIPIQVSDQTQQQALGAAAAARQACEELWHKVSTFQIPSQQEFIQSLPAIQVWQAAVMIVVGLIYLLYGWKIFKVLVVLNAMVLGFVLGASLGKMHSQLWALYGSMAGAVILAVLALPLMRFAISLMGALVGAFAGYHIWNYVIVLMHRTDLTQFSWVGGVIGLLVLGALTFLLFKLAVMLFTSIQGSFVMVSGVLALLLKYQPFYDKAYEPLANNVHLLPLLVAGPALLGLMMQGIFNSRCCKKAAAQPK